MVRASGPSRIPLPSSRANRSLQNWNCEVETASTSLRDCLPFCFSLVSVVASKCYLKPHHGPDAADETPPEGTHRQHHFDWRVKSRCRICCPTPALGLPPSVSAKAAGSSNSIRASGPSAVMRTSARVPPLVCSECGEVRFCRIDFVDVHTSVVPVPRRSCW